MRLVWHMSFNAVVRWRDRTKGFNPPRPMLRATVGSGVVTSWPACTASCRWLQRWRCPAASLYRDPIVLTALSVMLGTLVIQG